MSFARGSRHEVSYVPEVVKGVTPATPVMKLLRVTSVGLEMTKGGFQSSELRSDRQIADFRHGTKQVAGDLGLELSYEAFDDLLAGALFNSWSSLATVVSSAIAATGANQLTGSFSGFAAGDQVSVEGFSTAANNGLWQLAAATAATLTVEGALAPEAAGNEITLTRHPRLAGAAEEKTFTVERRFTGLAIPQYHVFTGCMVNKLALSVKPDGMVTGTLGLMGMGAATSGTSLGEPAAAQANSPFDSFRGSLAEGGSTVGVVTGLDLSLENGINPAYVVGSDQAADLVDGRANLTGTLTAFFEDSELLDKFINESETSLVLMLEDVHMGASRGNRYYFHLPRLKFTGGSVQVSEEGAVPISLPFQALYDADHGYTLAISKAAHD
ncbi:MAG: hypothetical protein KQJ78_18315 [Deltaproteobacteria bacterium]|nr:hypothetical protein [Deltaproteobacteria bacterium]